MKIDLIFNISLFTIDQGETAAASDNLFLISRIHSKNTF